jgi:transcriptional regulator of acetoin/glycerol metabolism
VIAEKGLLELEHMPAQVVSSQAGSIPGETERAALVDALRAAGGNQTRAAKILGVNRVTVWNRMRKYGIDPKRILL